MCVSLLIKLIVLILKKWKGQPRTEYETRDKGFIKKNAERYNPQKKPWVNTETKLYIWMQKIISKIPLPNYLQEKCQQLVNNEESSKYFTMTNKPHTEDYKLRNHSFFKTEKQK